MNAVLNGVTQQIAFEKRSFRISNPQNGPRGLPGVPWEASRGDSGVLLGAPGRLLGRSKALLGFKIFAEVFKNAGKNSKFVLLEALGLLSGVPRAI